LSPALQDKKRRFSLSGRNHSHLRKTKDDKKVTENYQVVGEHICTVCGQAFQWIRKLRLHVENEHPTFKFEEGTNGLDVTSDAYCSVDKKEEMEDMIEEQSSYSKLNTTCFICNEICIDEERLQSHLLEHSSLNYFVCPECGVTLSNILEFRSHLESHKQRMKCSNCRKCFSTEESLANHISSVHGDNSKNSKDYNCWDCDKKCGSSGRLRRHITAHVGEQRRSGACDICGKLVDNQMRFLKHMKSHKSRTLVTCETCGKTFKFPCDLSDHIKVVHNGIKPYSCKICGKEFIVRTGLRYHRRIHTGVYPPRPYVCTVCGQAFEHNCTLSYHMKRHTGERSLMCNVCSKSFHMQSHLNSHMKCHSNERSFACQVCPSRLKTNAALRRHMKIHSEQPSVSCTVCGKGFNQVGNLKVHMRTHSGERPYQCNVCGQSFPHQGTWKKHFDTHQK